jgi:hypothetical protein
MRSFLLGVSLGTLGSILFKRVRYRLETDTEDSSRATAANWGDRSADEPREGEEVNASDDLSRLSAAEPYRRTRLAGIAGRSGMSKAQLIAALRARKG